MSMRFRLITWRVCLTCIRSDIGPTTIIRTTTYTICFIMDRFTLYVLYTSIRFTCPGLHKVYFAIAQCNFMIVLHNCLASGTFNAVALTGTWYWYQELVLPSIIPVPAPGIGSSTCNIYKNVYATRYLVLTVISLDNAPRGASTILVENSTPERFQ